jgi:hypothetical protein
MVVLWLSKEVIVKRIIVNPINALHWIGWGQSVLLCLSSNGSVGFGIEFEITSHVVYMAMMLSRAMGAALSGIIGIVGHRGSI